ncbi:MAG: outer membrane lipoprotein carrier protein LolA [Pseudomonadota bacterium]
MANDTHTAKASATQFLRAAALIMFAIVAGLFLGAGVSQMVRAQVDAAPINAPEAPAAADVRAWLKSTRSLNADFTQQGADGQFVRGTLSLQQPGRLRFEYEPSVEMLIVAREGTIYFIDYEVNQLSRYPIKETPLAPLLNPDVIDTVPLRVTEVVNANGDARIYVTSEDPKHREYGTLTMVFERTGPKGVSLRSWSVLDGQGNLTQITLSNVRENVEIAQAAFKFRDPRRKKGPRRPQ